MPWGYQADTTKAHRCDSLAIIGAVVHAYFELERSYELVEVAEREERQRQEILDITQHRYKAGLDKRRLAGNIVLPQGISPPA